MNLIRSPKEKAALLWLVAQLCSFAALGQSLRNPTTASGGAAQADGTLLVVGELAAGRVSAGGVTLSAGAAPAWLAAMPPVTSGDLNCDGFVDFDDISPFVRALVSQSTYEARHPNCRWLNGDIDGNGDVNFDDISPFVKCLVAGGCP
jgi:hypothetical protein